MSKHLDRIGKIALGAAIVGALGFGATMAVAAPSETEAGTASACIDPDPCIDYCTSHGYLDGKCMFRSCYCLTSTGGWARAPGDPP